jgi:hypothetical protein
MEMMEMLLRRNDEWYWGGLASRQAAEPHFEDASTRLTTHLTGALFNLRIPSCGNMWCTAQPNSPQATLQLSISAGLFRISSAGSKLLSYFLQ